MKHKLILPLFAVAFALAGAFASPLLVQTGWYDSNGAEAGGGVQGNITDPPGDTPACSISATSHQCRITTDEGDVDAYDTQQHAETLNSAGLLKYN